MNFSRAAGGSSVQPIDASRDTGGQRDDGTVALLIRHGHTEAIGRRLVGRLPGITLSTSGLTPKSSALRRGSGGSRSTRSIRAHWNAPVETAAPIGRRTGTWTSVILGRVNRSRFRRMDRLHVRRAERLPAWRRFNMQRSTAAVPSGEPAARRADGESSGVLDGACARHAARDCRGRQPHADVIRTAVLHCAGNATRPFRPVPNRYRPRSLRCRLDVRAARASWRSRQRSHRRDAGGHLDRMERHLQRK